MNRIFLLAASAVFFFACAAALIGEECFYYLPVNDLEITGGELPGVSDALPRADRGGRTFRTNQERFLKPYAVGGQGEEIYIASSAGGRTWNCREAFNTNLQRLFIAIRTTSDRRPSGKLYLPEPDFSGLLVLDFAVPRDVTGSDDARDDFLKAKETHYGTLVRLAFPGSPWFRHQRDEAVRTGASEPRPVRAAGIRENELQRTFGLFTGGRAISENIQVDRELRVLDDSAALTVPVDSIEGITISAIDWGEAAARKDVKKDALAHSIPYDQHAVFFPSFASLVEVIDETRERGTPVLRLMEQRSEDARTLERYEKQLCLPLDEFARILGPTLISSVAMTGSDPYLRTGSDVAVLFETVKTAFLKTALTARYSALLSEDRSVEMVTGSAADGSRYVGVVSPRREICSYLASRGSQVVVSNSLYQLNRVLAAACGRVGSLADLGEYTFFRYRYPLGDRDESALLIVSDDTIRRWCGPRWRIAASRRTRAAAALSSLQARYFEEIESGNVKAGRLYGPQSIPGLDDLRIDRYGVYSRKYGTLAFLTPIAELVVGKASEAEENAYAVFRDSYQRRWRQFFDPIAARFAVKPDRIDLDLSVMPLIGASDYREFMEITGNAAIPSDGGDRHAESGLHFIMSIDKDSAPMRQASSFASSMVPGLEAKPLRWMGEWVSLYADEGSFWDGVTKSRAAGGRNEVEEFLEENAWNIPVALHIDVANPFFMTGFLTALRAYIDQTAPGMLHWETRKHGELQYVRVTPSEAALAEMDDELRGMAIHYAALPDALIVSLDEGVVGRAIDRRIAKVKSADEEGGKDEADRRADRGWLGRSVAVDARQSALAIIEAYFHDDITALLERRSWSNIMILNEWRRRFAAADAVVFHETFWKTRLVCPGNGEYVWNERYQTMESTVFGFPGCSSRAASAPGPFQGITAAGFGLTFEHGGLRARASIERTPDAEE